MFRLTRRERTLVIAILLAFVTGLVVKHVRETSADRAADPSRNAAQQF